jgi:choline dehydrogenase
LSSVPGRPVRPLRTGYRLTPATRCCCSKPVGRAILGGWSYVEVLPFFKIMESYAGGGDDAFRGREGPLRVTNPEPRDPLFATIIKAAAEVGIRRNPDYNGASQEGIAMSQATIAAGRRMSTARCYLDPIRKRRNLHIETETLTEGLVLDGKRCTGVRYSVAGDVREARAAREVVVSAGTINSPQLLELSGIGQPERLRNLGIECAMRSPASAKTSATITCLAPAG